MANLYVTSILDKDNMYIARMYYPVTTLGYGKRVGIWVTGCNKNCVNCMSSDLKEKHSGIDISPTKIVESITSNNVAIDGITISGGEPFLQFDELYELLRELNKKSIDDIIIYTGYTLEELTEKFPAEIDDIKSLVSVLVDGEYIDHLNDNIGLRGSNNQKIHIWKYHERHASMHMQERKIQAIEHDRGITLIGIP